MLWRDSTRPLIMGIVNVTPDSFSGDGAISPETAIAQGLRMIEEGADILDIGGESTRPDASLVDQETELRRVLPVIEGIRKHSEILISIDTMKAGVARAAFDAGANWINDVTAGEFDTEMLPLAAKLTCPIILMHNRAKWQNAASFAASNYMDFIVDLTRELAMIKDNATQAGIKTENIILDPGIGFGKSVMQNCQIIREMKRLDMGFPILIGASRKSFIGKILGGEADERLEGTAAAVALSVVGGAAILRVHDVKEMRKVADMAYAIASSQSAL